MVEEVLAMPGACMDVQQENWNIVLLIRLAPIVGEPLAMVVVTSPTYPDDLPDPAKTSGAERASKRRRSYPRPADSPSRSSGVRSAWTCSTRSSGVGSAYQRSSPRVGDRSSTWRRMSR